MPEIFLTAKWKQLIMANFEVDPAVLLPYVPNGVVLDTFQGKAFVSLVGFMFTNTSLFSIPIPFFGSFEEVNLRFYVKRIHEGSEKRGVVFINETVPFQIVAWLANKLYKENYIAIPTRHQIQQSESVLDVQYSWKKKGHWNNLKVVAETTSRPMEAGSMEEFIFEHYYGFTGNADCRCQQYQVGHPRWEVHKVMDYTIDCDFRANYGESFAALSIQQPHSVFLAKGSPVHIKWKRETL